MSYDDVKPTKPILGADGRVTHQLVHTSADPDLKPVTQAIDATPATEPFDEWLRASGIRFQAHLNKGHAYIAAVDHLIGESLDTETPIAVPADEQTVIDFRDLWFRELELTGSVKAGSAKQAELDAAILKRKAAYEAATPELKPKLDAIMRPVF